MLLIISTRVFKEKEWASIVSVHFHFYSKTRRYMYILLLLPFKSSVTLQKGILKHLLSAPPTKRSRAWFIQIG